MLDHVRTGEWSGEHAKRSLLDEQTSEYLEQILEEARGSGDYTRARKEILELVERCELHEHQERLFMMVDKYKKGNADEERRPEDKGKGREVPREVRSKWKGREVVETKE